MKTEKLMLGAAFASVFAAVAVAAVAHGGAMGVVKQRMDGMGAMKEAVKVLTPMMQGQSDYDPGVVREQAGIIAAHGGDALTELFPEGSLDPPTEAKETIWQAWDDFAALAGQLSEVSQGLATAADNGLMMSGDAPARDMMASDMMAGDMMAGGVMASDMMGGDAMGTGMIGGMIGGMMGGAPGAMDFAGMPADGAFAMLGQVCSACHSRFRVEQ